MAKKQKFAENTDNAPVQNTEPMNATTESTESAQPAALARPSSHLVMSTADLKGRTAYRFAKCAEMPKKAARYPATVDGKPAEIAFTTSGGYAEVVGYNAYLQKPQKDDGSPGDIGWILFNDGVDPLDKEQFPDGYHFTTTTGLCDPNPKREPKNPDAENARRAASAAASAKRKAEREAAEAAAKAESGEGQTAESTEAQS
jgi:hypothetical protein